MAEGTHYKWDEVPNEQVADWLQRKMLVGERLMLARMIFKQGSTVVNHTHDNEQFTLVFSGAMLFTVEGKEIWVREGEVLHIPANADHSVIDIPVETEEMDIFSPPRQDWLAGNDAYLRQQVVR